MGTFNPEHFKDVIGEKIIFEGHPATIIDFVSCYEGDFWRIKIEGVYPPDQSVPCGGAAHPVYFAHHELGHLCVDYDRRGGLPAASSFMACAGDLGAAVGRARRVPDWSVQRLDLHALPVSGHRLHALRHRRHRHPQ